jgi:hypothetical protein
LLCPRLVMVAAFSPGQGRCPAGWPAASLDSGCGRCCWAVIGGSCWWAAQGAGRWAWRESAGLVVPGRVEGEFADQLAGVAADDADVQAVDEQGDAGAEAGGAESDVVESAVVAQGDGAAGVDGVVADPVVGGDLDTGEDGFGSSGVGLGAGASCQRAVRPDGVVVASEPVQLALQRPIVIAAGWAATISSGFGPTTRCAWASLGPRSRRSIRRLCATKLRRPLERCRRLRHREPDIPVSVCSHIRVANRRQALDQDHRRLLEARTDGIAIEEGHLRVPARTLRLGGIRQAGVHIQGRPIVGDVRGDPDHHRRDSPGQTRVLGGDRALKYRPQLRWQFRRATRNLCIPSDWDSTRHCYAAFCPRLKCWLPSSRRRRWPSITKLASPRCRNTSQFSSVPSWSANAARAENSWCAITPRRSAPSTECSTKRRSSSPATKVAELAEGKPVTIGADDSVEEALRTMTQYGVRRLPVIDGHDLVGIVSQADVARNLPEDKLGDLVEAISSAPANN